MSSTDRTGKFGPGAISAAEKAVGGGGALPTPPPRPGALHASSLAAQSVTETLAATVPPTPAAPLSPLSDEAVRAKIARAGLRQFKRDFLPPPSTITTPTGNASSYNVYEKNTQGQRIAYVRTSDDDFPGTTEPKSYVEIAKHITPTAAAAVLGIAPLSAEETVAARRAATTANALAIVSEQQRNGGGKHARAALRTIARQQLTPHETYAGDTPAFAQANTVQDHRDVISGASEITPGFRKVLENFSGSSDDEAGAALSPAETILRYRKITETKAVRDRLTADASAGAEVRPAPARQSRKRAAPPPVKWENEPDLERPSKRPRTRSVTRKEAEAAKAEQDHHPTEARATHKHSAKGEKELDRKRDSKRGRR